MKLNKISITETKDKLKRMPEPKFVGETLKFYLAGHSFICESDLKKNCFNLEWKIIEIK